MHTPIAMEPERTNIGQPMPAQEIDMASFGTYLIRVQGNLSANWLEYFDDISIIVSAPTGSRATTTIITHDADQAALHGLLSRLFTFGYPLLYLELVSGK